MASPAQGKRSARELVGIAALLLAAEAVGFAFVVPRAGFYLDDWIFLDLTAGPGGLLAGMRGMLAAGYAARPGAILHFAVLGALGGFSPGFYLAVGLALKALEGFLLFLLLERLWRGRAPALAAAALAVLHPARAATHFWYCNSNQGVASCLVLGSLLVHEAWLRRGGTARLLGSLALYLAGALFYESGALLPLALAAVVVLRRRGTGPRPEEARRLPLGLALYGACLLAVLAWIWSAAPGSLEVKLGRAPISPLGTYGAGFASILWRSLWLCWRSAELLWETTGPGPLAAAAAAGAALAGSLGRLEAHRPAASGSAALAAVTAAAIFIAAYGPLVAGGYRPDVFGALSRFNAIGAWAGAILLVALVELAVRRRAGLRATSWGFLAAAFLCADWYAGARWAEAAELQRDVLAKAAARARGLARGATLILSDAPGWVGGVPLFTESWAFELALRRATGRRDLSARVVSGRLAFEKEGIVERAGAAQPRGTPPVRASYRDTYLYRYGSDSLERLEGPPRGRSVSYSWRE
ncbi:MAG: hypothetical protein HY554_00565 [Elusimicrobia bacterium]|nr:hypothetical protein [Elusimicrobiota bacterium]